VKQPVNLRREALFLLSDVARAMHTYIDQRAREHGLTRAQWSALARLERHEGMTQAEMAEALEIQPISLVRLIDRLCLHRLLERRPHPRDRRANRLYLTEKGRATLAQLVPLGQAVAGEVMARLSEAEAAELVQKLLLVRNNIRHAMGKPGSANGAQAKWHQEHP
jgi:MarR family transcriptional regulator for hemolysin